MLYAVVLTLLLTVSAAAQALPKKGSARPKRHAVAAKKAPGFVSKEGRFSIDLGPTEPAFESLAPTADSPNEAGGKYMWDLPEGVISVEYSDDPDLVIKTKQDYADLKSGMEQGGATIGGKWSKPKAFTQGPYRGYQVSFVDPEGRDASMRVLIVKRRKYTVFGLARGTESTSLLKTLDTFRLTSAK